MVIETILGSIVGGGFRILPDLLKHFDKKNERAHELKMRDLDIVAAEKMADQKLKLVETQGQIQVDTAQIELWKAAVEAQSKPTGVRWVDALSAFVRPGVTYAFFFLYALVKIAMLVLAWQQADFWSAVLKIWGPEDQATFSAILTFWFVHRTSDKIFGYRK